MLQYLRIKGGSLPRAAEIFAKRETALAKKLLDQMDAAQSRHEKIYLATVLQFSAVSKESVAMVANRCDSMLDDVDELLRFHLRKAISTSLTRAEFTEQDLANILRKSCSPTLKGYAAFELVNGRSAGETARARSAKSIIKDLFGDPQASKEELQLLEEQDRSLRTVPKTLLEMQLADPQFEAAPKLRAPLPWHVNRRKR